jgi:hypothetical protein
MCECQPLCRNQQQSNQHQYSLRQVIRFTRADNDFGTGFTQGMRHL